MTYLYRTWAGIMQRTTNPNNTGAHRYSERGITVAKEFQRYEVFRGYVLQQLGPRPENYSIDRIDNSKGYQRGNLRWASTTTQNRNQDRNIRFEDKGEMLTVMELKEKYRADIDKHALAKRLKNGWPVEKALHQPVRPCVRKPR